MEIPRIAVFSALLFLALIGSDATSLRSAEEHSHSIWPHTPMPQNLYYLLGSGVNDGEMEDTQLPCTSFFEDDLHAGKQMNIKFKSPYSPQTFGVDSRKRMEKDPKKSTFTQPFATLYSKRNTKEKDPKKSTFTQAFAILYPKSNTMEKDPEKLTMEEICNREKFVGEKDKVCTESIESLLDFVILKLGKDIEALTSSFVPHQTQYKILEGVQRVSSEGVMCHKLNFEKPAFYCHQVNASIAYTIPMEAADGTRTTVLAVCHHDTRGFDPDMLFHDLKVMPGTVPVCHFIGNGAIAWVPRENMAAY